MSIELDATLWLLTALAGFAAGLIDSIVGGGGLVLTPAMLNLHPQLHILQAIGTQRTSSIMGTSVAAWNYLRRIKVERRILVPACIAALSASAVGVQLAKRIDGEVLKWTVLAICVVLAIYTVFRKDLGLREDRRFHPKHETMAAVAIGAATGFYNGLIGPGTGTLMVFAFVSFLGLDFLKSSAVSKTTNVAADLSSWTVLALGGFVLWTLAIPLIIGNMIGSYIGSHMAIKRGQGFVRAVFLVIVLALIARQAWQLATQP
ncbi:sulfite exporter TauE/SafE family protein [Lysobacter brunescens]|uniref:Probable membrane transporter protein n=1 Tax=Lysobacter brunescens TaxID=262323 RepID=A0ABW2YAJ9_9GAMM